MLRQFLLLAVSITASAAILAAEPVAVRVPAGDMAAALESLAKQTGIELIFQPDDVKGLRTSGVNGTLTPQEAAATLIRGTRLTITTNVTGAILIAPPRPEKGAGRTIGSTSLVAGDVASQSPRVAQTVDLSVAPENPSKHFDIKKGSLDEALKEFQSQSRLIVVAPTTMTAGKKASAVRGDLTPTDALGRLLKGSGLTFARTADGTIVIQALAASGPTQSNSKETQGAQEQSAGLAEILVKGSRTMNVDVTRTEDDAQPYYIFNSQQIQQSGLANAEDFLKNMLTMNTAFLNNSQQYAGLPISSINLRGLGTNETLILIDGRRSANVSYIGVPTQPDINGIPLAAIERIEVLPSSASAIYGGAALGGVVNIILKKQFNGGELSYHYDNPVSGNAPTQTVNAVYGFSLGDGRTRVMLSGHYTDNQPLLLQERLDLEQRGVSTILANSPSDLYNFSNPFSGSTPNIACQDANGNPTNCVLRTGISLNSPITSIPKGAAPGSNLSAALLANAGRYNLTLPPGTEQFGLQSPLGIVPTTKSLMATIRHEFTDSMEAFTEISTISNANHQVYNPFGGSYPVPASAPTNPFQQSVMVNFPDALSAPATSDSVSQSATVGLIAHLPRDWRSELDYTWSANTISFVTPSVDSNTFDSALAAGTVNPFTDTLSYPPTLTPYVGSLFASTRSTLNDLALRASGPIGSFPWGIPTLTVGLEHRKEGYDNSPTFDIFPSDSANSSEYIQFGQSQSTDSVYAEANVPLVTAKNTLPGIQSLDLQLAGRSEHYRVFAGTPLEYISPPSYVAYNPPQGVHSTISYTSTNPTIGLKFRPIESVTLRASYATAFLPPTAFQLLPSSTPFCPSACQQITDPRNGDTYNVNVIYGGNPRLQPQTSRDLDLGVIWEPGQDFLKGLRLDLQHYNIVQPNYITTPTVQQVVSDPTLASRVTRNPTTGIITLVNLSYLNATKYKTDGWDFTMDYSKPTSVGTFGVHMVGTLIDHDLRQYSIGTPFLENAGYPADGGEAKIKANLTVRWKYRWWMLAWTATYVSSYYQYDTPGSPIYTAYGNVSDVAAAQGSNSIPSQTYHTVFGSYSFEKSDGLLSNLTIQLGIKNVFNTLPPFDANSGPYFYSPYGDPRLRDFWVSIRKGFGS